MLRTGEVMLHALASLASLPMRYVPCVASHAGGGGHQGNKNLSFSLFLFIKYSPWIIYCI